MTDDDPQGASRSRTLRGFGAALVTDTERGDPPYVAPPSVPPSTDPSLPTGFHDGGTFGRFTILDILGAGGMGVVLAAYDPQLSRKVAIKVLRTRGLTPERREQEAERLLQEARAMAQLSHTNVVTVYEAGTLDERVFIAMEYIAGQTLRTWLAERRRTVAEVLDVYGKAGRGLAAAHAAGVIHRDFKPDNVLVGADGRVRVIDFGLARPDDATTGDDEAPLGTPVYMAPEQHRRLRVDARADQFAFCVCVFQALYGRLPFGGANHQELAANVVAGEVDPPPGDTRVPPRVTEALLRGLQANPDDRFGSMEPLLDALQVAPFRRRSRTLLAALLAALGAAGVTLVVVRLVAGGDDHAACAGGEARFAGVWDGPVKERVRAAFTASNRSHAPQTLDRVVRDMDAFAHDWVARRQSVCEATRVRHEQSEAAFDARMGCLVDQLDEVRALASLFAGAPDPQLTDKAAMAVERLPQPSACVAVAAAAVAPLAPADRPLVEDVRREAAKLRALRDAGKFPAAVEQTKALIARAQPLHYVPLLAELQLLLGQVASGAGQGADAEAALREAVRLAALAKDDATSARAWTLLVQVVGFQLARYQDALALQPVAEAAIARADGGGAMEGDLQNNIANTHFQKGEYALAKTAYETALALRMKALGPEHPDVAAVHNSLGGVLLRQGDLDGATVHFQRALEIREKALGPNHPDVALPLGNLGAVAQLQKRPEDAMRYLGRALTILTEVLGPDHPNVGLTLSNLGGLSRDRGDCAVAIGYYERALATLEKLGADHPYVALPLVGLAHCRTQTGDAKGGVAAGERAVAVLAKQDGDPAALAEARFALAKGLWATGDKPRAKELIAQAKQAFTAVGAAGADGLSELTAWVAAHP